MNSKCSKHIKIPLLPLRDIVVYPHMIISLFIGREKSIKCIEKISIKKEKILLLTQKKSSIEDPKKNDLFKIGTVAKILQIFKLPNGTIKILVEGLQRAKISSLKKNKEYFSANIKYINFKTIKNKEDNLLIKTAIKKFEEFVKLNKTLHIEILKNTQKIKNVEKLSDTIASNINLKISDKQNILEIINPNKRLEHIIVIMESEINLLKIEKKIRNRVKKQMEKSQKEYYLNEQMKAIKKELNKIENVEDENEILKKKINSTKFPKKIKNKINIEFNKLKSMPYMSSESAVIKSYIDWIIQIPWSKRGKIKKNLHLAKKILDKDHYGLKKVKDRIIEYLAVQSRAKKVTGPILCLVGPPGVGKTSLGKSIAKATGRKYIKMSLGGIRDEAEIRGHRKTYVGSMPGKIIQKMSEIGVKNPLFLLDEIDKISYDARIDPYSALLEVLDPEQNFSFNDHYLEIDYDLSEVMFVATSNTLDIPYALLDRMEIIKLSGYTEEEKLFIAKNHLIPKQIKRNILNINEIEIADEVLLKIIRYYTKEAGIRNLDREISKICRKTVKKLSLNKKIKKIKINSKNIKNYLGVKKFDYGKASSKNKIGQVVGLAWTEVGGELLNIEAACVPGKGKLTYTGSLGDIMKESIQASLIIIRSQSKKLGIKPSFYENHDIHIHVPDGSTPKDGPSAGISMCTAITSCLTKNPVKSNFAMTGEITLQGKILNIGGLKEKLLAAHRGGIKNVVIPYKNKRDLEEIPKNILFGLKIHKLKKIEEVLILSLKNFPYKNFKNFKKK
ncbi:endopeptidase La [Buchnera aphidicola (Ceratoglyphina bambusae)]|uniref:endopeptidase La n=1 Tax=Buchnera aphidicola TaxID=9 RepID=UPI0031B81337